MATITSTNFVLPQTVVSNGGTTGALWLNPENLLLSDNLVAFSQSTATQASDVVLGNYNLNLPATAVVTGIEMEIIGYRGAQTAPVITITPTLVDNTSGTDAFYPLTPAYAGLTTTSATHILGGQNFLFNSSFTPNQINNAKLQLVANGAVYIDTAKLKVYYYVPDTTGTPTGTTAGCPDCNSQIQTQIHRLALNLTASDTKMYLEDFVYADGTPVQVSDLGSCGGYIDFVLDNGKEKGNGQRFEENVRSGYWEVLPSGLVEVDFGVVIDFDTLVGTFSNQEIVTGGTSGATGILSSFGDTSIIVSKVTGTFQVGETITGGTSLATLNTTAVDPLGNRGLKFKTPYNSDPTLISAHNASAEVIISNNAPYEDRWLKKCQKDTFFSPPIDVLKDGASVVDPVHTFDFKGTGVSVIVDPSDPFKANITIPGTGTTPPVVVDTVTNTSNNVQVINLTMTGLQVQGVNRGVLVQIATEELASVVSVVGNGSEVFTQEAVATDAGNNLRTEQWFLAAPTAGTMDIVVTLSQAAYLTIGSEALQGVDQVAPIGANSSNTGTSNTPSTTNVTTTDNALVFDSVVTALTPILYTVGANQTLNWSQTANTVTRQGSSSYEQGGTAPDNVVMDYTITQNTDWVITSLEITGVAGDSFVVKDEGIVIDSEVTEQDFTGAGVTVTPVSPGKVQIDIPGGGGSALTIQDESVNVDTATTLINFLGSGVTATTAGAGLVDVTIPGGGVTDAVVLSVNQVAHGFVEGDWVRVGGAGTYTKAQANSSTNAEVIGVVTNVVGVNEFELTTEGIVTGAWVPSYGFNQSVFLSTSVAGGTQAVSTSTIGSIDKPLGVIIEDAVSMKVSTYRGRQITSATSGAIVTVPQQFYSGKDMSANRTFTAGGEGDGTQFYSLTDSIGFDAVSIERIDKDPQTGLYRKTSFSSGINTTGGEDAAAVTIDDNFVYVIVDRDSTPPFAELRRFDRDLGSETLMTGLVSPDGARNYQGIAMKKDTNQLYILRPDNVTVDVHDISGTTVNLVSTFTLTGHTGNAEPKSFRIVNGELWAQRENTGNIIRWDISGNFVQEDLIVDLDFGFGNAVRSINSMYGFGYSEGQSVYEIFFGYILSVRSSGTGLDNEQSNYLINTYSIL